MDIVKHFEEQIKKSKEGYFDKNKSNPLHDKNCMFVVLKTFANRNSNTKQDYPKAEPEQIYNRSGLTALGYNYDREVKTLLDSKMIHPYNKNDCKGLGQKEITKLSQTKKVELRNEEPTKELPKIHLPLSGRTNTLQFIKRTTNILKNTKNIFYRIGDDQLVEYQNKELRMINPSRCISLLEENGEVVSEKYTKDEGWIDYEKSAGETVCKTLLNSPHLKSHLPLIEKILKAPIPFIENKELHFPKTGYNHKLKLYLEPGSPEIDENISVETAKKELIKIHKEFCYKSENDILKSLMALITPFLRGIYTSWSVRTPVIIYFANRERAGKDFCAGIRSIIYTGYAIEEAPISTGKRDSNSNDELRKKILSTIIIGKNLLHFSNNKGHINNSVLEQASTAQQISDRVLGKNQIATFPNALEISLSGNIGTTLTPDLANRSLIIQLHLSIENANDRKFSNPNLHNEIFNKRSFYLSCLYALVRNWYEQGMPVSKVPFASFPEWAGICGGIMESAGWVNPLGNVDKSVINLDTELEDMKIAFEVVYERCADTWISKHDFIGIIGEEELFSYIDFSEQSGKVRFGKLLDKFIGRELSGITLVVDETKRKARQSIMFSKVNVCKVDFGNLEFGSLGSLGSLSIRGNIKGDNNIYKGIHPLPTLPNYQPHYQEQNKLNVNDSHTSIQNDTTNELIHHKCSFCGETPCADWHLGKPVCKECFEGLKAQKVQKW